MNERNMKFFRSHLLLSFLEANWQTVSLFWFLCEYLCCSAMPSLFQSYCKVTQDRSLMLGREHLINSLLFLSNNKARNLIYLNWNLFSIFFVCLSSSFFWTGMCTPSFNMNVRNLTQFTVNVTEIKTDWNRLLCFIFNTKDIYNKMLKYFEISNSLKMNTNKIQGYHYNRRKSTITRTINRHQHYNIHH